MSTFRFSLLTLFGVTAYVAIGAAALYYNAASWADSLRGIVALSLLSSVLAAFYGRAQLRPYWAGFSLFGWAYFMLSDVVDRLTGESVRLPTASLIDSLWFYYSWLAHASGREFEYETFLVIGHSLFTLPFALIGGIIARVMYARSRRDGGNPGPGSLA